MRTAKVIKPAINWLDNFLNPGTKAKPAARAGFAV
jgi:hypothetical protein